MYADYHFYVNEYGGDSLDEEAFERYSVRASNYIDAYTHNKSYDYYNGDNRNERTDRSLALACCNVAEVLEHSTTNTADSGAYASETVGAHTVSYRSGSEMSEDMRKQVNSVLGNYLAGTGCLYRGIPVCIPRML